MLWLHARDFQGLAEWVASPNHTNAVTKNVFKALLAEGEAVGNALFLKTNMPHPFRKELWDYIIRTFVRHTKTREDTPRTKKRARLTPRIQEKREACEQEQQPSPCQKTPLQRHS